jgi:hypothetical protein
MEDISTHMKQLLDDLSTIVGHDIPTDLYILIPFLVNFLMRKIEDITTQLIERGASPTEKYAYREIFQRLIETDFTTQKFPYTEWLSNMFKSLFPNGLKRGRAVLERETPTKQCNMALGSGWKSTLCYICGRLPHANESLNECEHLLPIIKAVYLWGLISRKTPINGQKTIDYYSKEYKNSHKCCNRVKNNKDFITYLTECKCYVLDIYMIADILHTINTPRAGGAPPGQCTEYNQVPNFNKQTFLVILYPYIISQLLDNAQGWFKMGVTTFKKVLSSHQDGATLQQNHIMDIILAGDAFIIWANTMDYILSYMLLYESTRAIALDVCQTLNAAAAAKARGAGRGARLLLEAIDTTNSLLSSTTTTPVEKIPVLTLIRSIGPLINLMKKMGDNKRLYKLFESQNTTRREVAAARAAAAPTAAAAAEAAGEAAVAAEADAAAEAAVEAAAAAAAAVRAAAEAAAETERRRAQPAKKAQPTSGRPAPARAPAPRLRLVMSTEAGEAAVKAARAAVEPAQAAAAAAGVAPPPARAPAPRLRLVMSESARAAGAAAAEAARAAAAVGESGPHSRAQKRPLVNNPEQAEQKLPLSTIYNTLKLIFYFRTYMEKIMGDLQTSVKLAIKYVEVLHSSYGKYANQWLPGVFTAYNLPATLEARDVYTTILLDVLKLQGINVPLYEIQAAMSVYYNFNDMVMEINKNILSGGGSVLFDLIGKIQVLNAINIEQLQNLAKAAPVAAAEEEEEEEKAAKNARARARARAVAAAAAALSQRGGRGGVIPLPPPPFHGMKARLPTDLLPTDLLPTDPNTALNKRGVAGEGDGVAALRSKRPTSPPLAAAAGEEAVAMPTAAVAANPHPNIVNILNQEKNQFLVRAALSELYPSVTLTPKEQAIIEKNANTAAEVMKLAPFPSTKGGGAKQRGGLHSQRKKYVRGVGGLLTHTRPARVSKTYIHHRKQTARRCQRRKHYTYSSQKR